MAVVVEQVLRLRDEATAALNKAAQAARESASALNVTEEAAVDAGQAFDRGGASAQGMATELDDVTNAAKRAKTALDGTGASAGRLPGVVPGAPGMPSAAPTGPTGGRMPTDPFGPVGTSADKAAVSVGNLNQRAGSLVQQLIDVGVMLQMGSNPFTILVQQGPQIATAIGGASTAAAVLKTVWAGLTATVGAILPFLGPIAVGIAAITTVYAVGANAVDAYADANGRAGERLEMLQGKLQSTYDAVANVAQVYAQFAARQNEINDRIGVLTGSITASDAAYRKEAESINIAYKAAVQADTQRLQTIALNAQLLRQQAATEMMLPSTRAGILAQAASYEGEAKAIKERIQAAKQSRDVSLDLADSERILKNEKDKNTQAEKSATKATKERNKELKESTALFRGLEEALIAYNLAQVDAFAGGGSFITPETIGNLRTMQATMEQLIPQTVLSRAEQLEMLLADIALARSRDGGAANGAFDEMERQIRAELPKAWADGVAEGLTEAEAGMRDFFDKMQQQLRARLARIGQVVGDALSGDLVSALQGVLSSAGPIGAMIGAVMGGVQTLGQQGAKGTAKMAVEGLDSLIKGISNIPELLVQLIPRLITQTFPDLIVALVGMLPKLAVAILIELPVAIVRGIVRWWRDIGGFTGLVKNIAAGIRDWWTGVWDRIRSWFKDIFTPGDQSRGRGPSQKEQDRAMRDLYSPGAAAIRDQQREMRDIQNAGRSRQMMRPMGLAPSQAAPSIVINSDVVDVDAADRLARRLNRQFGTNGRRTNPVLGAT
jgi:hypothetical protein